MYKKILLATDGSDGALKAAETAAQLAKEFGAHVTMLYVSTLPVELVPVGLVTGGGLDPGTVARLSEGIEDAVARRTAKVLDDAGVKFDARHETGHAADHIVRAAAEGGYDLIVLGSHGHGGIARLFLGSTSDRVVHHAHCPVLVVK